MKAAKAISSGRSSLPVFSERASARKFLDAGVQDSKRITSDARIHSLAKMIRETPATRTRSCRSARRRYNQSLRKIRKSK